MGYAVIGTVTGDCKGGRLPYTLNPRPIPPKRQADQSVRASGFSQWG